MARRLVRAAIAMPVAALLGAAALLAAMTLRPAVVLEMDRHLPSEIATGFHGLERAGDLTFVWTSRTAVIGLPGLDRRLPWLCTLRFRGSGPNLQQTQALLEVDGLVLERAPASAEFQEVRVRVPPRPGRPGLTLGVTSSETFVPGPRDRRELGLLVDRLTCAPERGGLILPPSRAAAAAAGGAALFAGAVALAGAGILASLGIACLLAAAHALLLSSGLAAYGGFPAALLRSAATLAVAGIIFMRLLEGRSRTALAASARFAVVVTACAIHLKLLGLFHPSKLLIDAVFHAHRLEWVLAGRYFFTQPLPSGVTFPYAIGLYVFAAPWTLLIGDYVSLLRTIVIVAEALGALLLYPVIVKAWGSRWTGAAAVALVHVVPLPYGIVGNANLTNAFGQSVALITLAVLALGAFTRRRWLYAIGLWAIASLAFLSHISTFAQLFTTMLLVAAVFWWRGEDGVRRIGRTAAVVTLLAGAFATAAYYAHFGDVYRKALEVRADRASSAGQTGEADAGNEGGLVPLPARFAGAAALTRAQLGAPILILAALGIWSVWRSGGRDALTLLLAGWGGAYVVFVAVGVLPAVDAEFQRYAAEFVGRVNFAAYPAAAVLAARAAHALWAANPFSRLLSLALLALAAASGIRHWAGWFT